MRRNRKRAGQLLATLFVCATFVAPSATGSFTGSHDGANVSATWGWACDTSQPSTAISVYFYSYVDGTFGQIGSTLANQYRYDVAAAGVCGGDGYHGFVYTAYPQTGATKVVDGQSHDIYAYTYDNGFVLLPSSPQNVTFAPTNVWDPGLINGRWRTDYFSPTAGISSNPLLLESTKDASKGGGCWWLPPDDDIISAGASYNGYTCITSINTATGPRPATEPIPPNAPGSSHQTYAASSDGNFGGENYWVITANSEPAYIDSYTGLPPSPFGPPNQTDPISTPGQGLYALAILPDNEGGNPNRKKAHLIINKQLDPYKTTNRGPFLSYGVQSDWGNGHGTISLLGGYAGAKTTLKFAATLMDIYHEQYLSEKLNSGYVIIEAQWGGKKRWAYLSFLNNNNDGVADAPKRHFNWNILQGVWFPGADIVFKNLSTLDLQCPSRVSEWTSIGPMMDPTSYYNKPTAPNLNAARYSYTVDLTNLLRCLSPDFTDPMPATGFIPITGIHFAIEQGPDNTAHDAYLNYTWVAIDSVILQ